MEHSAAQFLTPANFLSLDDIVARNAVPAVAGVYGWWFEPACLPTVPSAGCVEHRGKRLLYAGISPKRPPANGKPPSSQTIRTRVKYHFRGNAEGSTLRLTLGCILSPLIAIELRRVGSGKRMTFGAAGEARLTEWMGEHARVTWVGHNQPWEFESEMIAGLDLPLNLDENKSNSFHSTLSSLRSAAKQNARSQPITDLPLSRSAELRGTAPPCDGEFGISSLDL